MLSIVPVNDVSADPLTPTIFHESWWLDIATGGRCDVAEVMEDGKVVGRLPYCFQKKTLGLSVVELPPLTHFLGPAVFDGNGKPNTRFSRRLEITSELIRKLPQTSAFYLKCQRDVTDVLAFQGAGFRAGVQFTHEVHPQPLDALWKSLRDTARNVIRAAREIYDVAAGDDPSLFMRFYAECIEKSKGVANHMEIDIHTKLISACLERDRGKIYEVRERNSGKLAATVFCAWDNVSTYYLMTSRTPAAHRGSTSLLIWEAISDAIKRNLIFDFDGVISESAWRTANNFTPILSPRYTATRESPPMRVIRAIKSVFREKNFYY